MAQILGERPTMVGDPRSGCLILDIVGWRVTWLGSLVAGSCTPVRSRTRTVTSRRVTSRQHEASAPGRVSTLEQRRTSCHLVNSGLTPRWSGGSLDATIARARPAPPGHRVVRLG